MLRHKSDGLIWDAARAVLAPSASYHESRADADQDHAQGWRKLLIVFGGDADMRVANADAVMFRVWKRNEERKNPQN
jgi:hypothetical protein